MADTRRYPANLPKRHKTVGKNRRSHTSRLASRFFLRLGWFVLLCAFAAVGWLIYGIRISYTTPVVSEYTVVSDKIDGEITLVLLTDLHGCEHGEDNCDLIEKIKEISPDLILMAGDMINSNDATMRDITVTSAFIGHISSVAPVYYSLGNHERDRIDRYYRDAMDHMEDAGAVVLDYDYVDLEINGNAVRLGGTYNVYVDDEPADYESAFWDEFCGSDDFTVLLEHRPHAYPEELAPNGYKVDLVLSGHIHGGQVILPVLGPVWGGNRGFFPEYSLGEYYVGEAKLIVSAGLSIKEEEVPRINNPTQIVKIVIKGE